MCSSFEKLVTREDSDLDEVSDSTKDYEIDETRQGNLPSFDSGNVQINNGVITCGRINKRQRILSSSTDEGDLENSDSNEIFSTLSWSKTNFNPMRHAFDNQNSGMIVECYSKDCRVLLQGGSAALLVNADTMAPEEEFSTISTMLLEDIEAVRRAAAWDGSEADSDDDYVSPLAYPQTSSRLSCDGSPKPRCVLPAAPQQLEELKTGHRLYNETTMDENRNDPREQSSRGDDDNDCAVDQISEAMTVSPRGYSSVEGSPDSPVPHDAVFFTGSVEDCAERLLTEAIEEQTSEAQEYNRLVCWVAYAEAGDVPLNRVNRRIPTRWEAPEEKHLEHNAPTRLSTASKGTGCIESRTFRPPGSSNGAEQKKKSSRGKGFLAFGQLNSLARSRIAQLGLWESWQQGLGTVGKSRELGGKTVAKCIELWTNNNDDIEKEEELDVLEDALTDKEDADPKKIELEHQRSEIEGELTAGRRERSLVVSAAFLNTLWEGANNHILKPALAASTGYIAGGPAGAVVAGVSKLAESSLLEAPKRVEVVSGIGATTSAPAPGTKTGEDRPVLLHLYEEEEEATNESSLNPGSPGASTASSGVKRALKVTTRSKGAGRKGGSGSRERARRHRQARGVKVLTGGREARGIFPGGNDGNRSRERLKWAAIGVDASYTHDRLVRTETSTLIIEASTSPSPSVLEAGEGSGVRCPPETTMEVMIPIAAKPSCAVRETSVKLPEVAQEKCANTGISPGDLLKPTRVLRGLTSSAGWTCSFSWYADDLNSHPTSAAISEMDQVRQSCAMAPKSLRNNSCTFRLAGNERAIGNIQTGDWSD
ncbi:hypothetical protein WN48_04065 [Eufriesea mexicana]|uniref:Uncharacterized protein n=1 Tax=Eufriesea mexicana TaxID=516756 RepID=A0A310S759_9HYME|nr:hypothetical protein WN48_04065 [Eufriesea mexicana]